jgi:polyhydroxyalkanoate synthase
MWKELNRWQEQMFEEARLNINRMGKLWELCLNPHQVEVGTSPKDVVYRENKASLYRYHSPANPVKSTPVLIVYALINRLYILDLYPGRSFIQHLLGEGLSVYAVDWGTPGPEDRDITLDYFIEGYLDRMVRKVMEVSGAPQISLFGYCLGGTLAAIYAALHPERIKNLVLLTTPINFAESGYLGKAVQEECFPLDAVVEAFGNVPPWFMQAGFKLLNPLGDLAKYYNFVKNMHNDRFLENFFAMETWVNDNIPFPGAAYRKYIKDLYQDNLLYKGLFEIDGRRVDLKQITANHLTVAASEDTIAPPQSAICIKDLISSQDNEALVLPGGHVGVLIGGRALKTTWPRITDWLLERSHFSLKEANNDFNRQD